MFPHIYFLAARGLASLVFGVVLLLVFAAGFLVAVPVLVKRSKTPVVDGFVVALVVFVAPSVEELPLRLNDVLLEVGAVNVDLVAGLVVEGVVRFFTVSVVVVTVVVFIPRVLVVVLVVVLRVAAVVLLCVVVGFFVIAPVVVVMRGVALPLPVRGVVPVRGVAPPLAVLGVAPPLVVRGVIPPLVDFGLAVLLVGLDPCNLE